MGRAWSPSAWHKGGRAYEDKRIMAGKKGVSFHTDPSIAFGKYQKVSLMSISLYLVANSLAFLFVL